MVVKGMNFVVVLCTIIAAIAGVFARLLFRRRLWLPLAASVIVFVGCLVWFLRPVCTVIPHKDLANFQPPIDTRTDTRITGQRYFQPRDGVWLHCKTWNERQLFF
jgi:hypothetical protein